MAGCSAIFLTVAPSILPREVLWWVAIIAIAGIIAGVVLAIYGRKSGVKEKSAKSVVIRKHNKKINDILDTVGAMDSRLYELLPVIDCKSLSEAQTNRIFSFRNTLSIFSAMIFPAIVKPQELISTLIDDNGIGVANVLNDEVYDKLNQKLESQLRLRSIRFRNAVYDHLRFWHMTYNIMLYLRAYKALKGERFGLLNSYSLRRLETVRIQGIGNMLVSLALKLAKEDKNEQSRVFNN